VLLRDAWSPATAAALSGPPTVWSGAREPARAILAGFRAIGPTLNAREEIGADGKYHVVFAPLTMKWENLNGWEKVSVTLQYAGAAAAIGYLASKLVH